jgi:hypothetical protein
VGFVLLNLGFYSKQKIEQHEPHNTPGELRLLQEIKD